MALKPLVLISLTPPNRKGLGMFFTPAQEYQISLPPHHPEPSDGLSAAQGYETTTRRKKLSKAVAAMT